jgi:Ca2+-binding RTX toxin-like protein
MKRKAILLLTTMATALVLTSGVALAAVIQCTGWFCQGTPNADTITGTASVDFIHGLAGSDDIRARDGGDLLWGGPGRDTLNGGASVDQYIFEDGWGADTIAADEPGSNDLVDFATLTSVVTVDLASSNDVKASSGTNTVSWSSTALIKRVSGGRAGDSIKGNGAGNDLSGSGGNDQIFGRRGNDVLHGDTPCGSLCATDLDAGDDTLLGGSGRDQIHGDAGDDTIFAKDTEADLVSCGPGTDTVSYDPGLDTLSSDCNDPAQPPPPV